MPACREYRQYLREGIRLCLGSEHEALLMGERISYLRMHDLEALFDLIFGVSARARDRAPAGYRPLRP